MTEIESLKAEVATLKHDLFICMDALRSAYAYVAPLADWENKNGTLAGIMPQEHYEVVHLLARAACIQSPRQVMFKIQTCIKAQEDFAKKTAVKPVAQYPVMDTVSAFSAGK